MSIKIDQLSDREIHVNQKLVRQDMDGQWVEKIELTPQERQALINYLHANEMLGRKPIQIPN